MTTTNLNIRTDRIIKENADKIYSELGLSMTTAVNLFLRATIRANGIPFDLKLSTDKETYRWRKSSFEFREKIWSININLLHTQKKISMISYLTLNSP